MSPIMRRVMITRWLSVLSILAGLLWHGTAWPISYGLDVTVSVGGRGAITKSFTGTEEVVDELPQLAVTDTSATTFGTGFGAAEVSPFRAHAVISTTGTSGNVTSRFSRVPIRFGDNQALRDLIAPGATSLDLLLNFQASVHTIAPESPGPSIQGQSSVNVAVGANSFGAAPLIFNRHQIGAFPLQSDFFVGLPDVGGDVTIPIPIAISPSIPNGLEVLAIGSILNQAFSVSSESTAEAEVSLTDLPESITLLDGTPASSRGIEYTFLPTVTSPDGNAVIPEPASLVLLGSGLFVLAFTRRKRVEGRAPLKT